MNYRSILILKNEKEQNIVERPRELIDNILGGIRGGEGFDKTKDIIVGHDVVGEILPLKSDYDETLYIYMDGKLVEFNPNDFYFPELKGDLIKYKRSIKLLETIYNKVKNDIIEIDNCEDGFSDLSDNIDNILSNESDVNKLSDE